MARIWIFTLVCLLAAAVVALQAPSGVQARPHHPSTPAPSPSPSQSPTPTPEERIKTLTQTVKDNPNDRNAQAELGQLLVDTGDPSGGRDHLENAVRLGQDDAQVWFYIGVADGELGDPQDAVTAFERAENLDPANPAVLSSLVDSYLRVNRVDDALRIGNRAVQLHPKEAFAYEILGLAQVSKGQFDQGRTTLQQALQIDPKDARAKLLIGRSYLGQQHPDLDKALAMFNDILSTDPKNTDALAAKSEALARKNDVAGAVAALQQVAKLEPDSVEPEDDIAQLYLDKNMPTQARQEFAQAIKDHPKAAEPFALQAEYDTRQKNYLQAEKEFESALALSPGNLSLLFDYGRMELLALRHNVKAQDAFSKLVNAQPDNPEALFWLGQAYAAENQWAQARDEYRASFAIARTYTALFNLGYADFNLKDYRQALEIFTALAAHQQKDHPDAQLWYMLGETQRLLGNKKQAAAAYRKFLVYSPSGSGADKARGYLKQLGQ